MDLMHILLPVVVSLLAGLFVMELFELVRIGPRILRRSHRRRLRNRVTALGILTIATVAVLIARFL